MFNSYVSLPEGTECECIRVNDYTMRFVVPNDPQMSNLLRSRPFGVFQRFSQPRILVHGIRRLMKAHRFQTLLDKTSPNCMGQITVWSNFIGIQRESPDFLTPASACFFHLGTGMQYLTSSTCGPVFLERDWGCAANHLAGVFTEIVAHLRPVFHDVMKVGDPTRIWWTSNFEVCLYQFVVKKKRQWFEALGLPHESLT